MKAAELQAFVVRDEPAAFELAKRLDLLLEVKPHPRGWGRVLLVVGAPWLTRLFRLKVQAAGLGQVVEVESVDAGHEAMIRLAEIL